MGVLATFGVPAACTSDGAASCSNDQDCDEGYCNQGQQRCVECIIDSHCGAATTCEGGTCFELGVCSEDDDCRAGQWCDTDAERCAVVVQSNVDTANGASAADVDTGTADAGSDAQPDDDSDDVMDDPSDDDASNESTDEVTGEDDTDEQDADDEDADGTMSSDDSQPDGAGGTDSSSNTDATDDQGGAGGADGGNADDDMLDEDEEDPVIPNEGDPLVMILIDESSGVFSALLPHGGSAGLGEFADTWEAMRAALGFFVAGAPQGLYWPVTFNYVEGDCPGLEARDVMEAESLGEVLSPSEEAAPTAKAEGPLGDAMQAAYTLLEQYEHDGPKHLLVLTDGAPGDTCLVFDRPPCGFDLAFGAARDAYQRGIQTRLMNFGGEEGVDFAEGVSHAGAGELVERVPDDDVYCLYEEAVARNEALPDDEEGLSDYWYEGGWTEYALGDYGDADYAYQESLAYHPIDAATLEQAVTDYLTFLSP